VTSPIPVLFIHGLWLHSTSWQPWIDLFTFPDRGHSLTIDNGWHDIADTTLTWLHKQNLDTAP
jgi:hypothetical protein